MRITRDTLLRAAKTATQQRTLRDRHIVCVYLTGSIIDDLPLLGGTADIDLVFVHDQEPSEPREIARLTPDVHLDLAHHDQTLYGQPKKLRLDPWIGTYLIKDPIVLYGTMHWFEYVQASVAAQFYEPENVLKRARPLAERARQTWLNFQLDPQEANLQSIWQYLEALEQSSNALALLNGPPITERRFLLQYPDRMKSLGYPGMADGLKDLLTVEPIASIELPHLVKHWQAALDFLGKQEHCPLALHPYRHPYYIRAVDALLEDQPAAALWIILRTWTRGMAHLDPGTEAWSEWQSAFHKMGYLGEGFSEHLNRLDAYLDQVETILDRWAEQNGVETSPISGV